MAAEKEPQGLAHFLQSVAGPLISIASVLVPFLITLSRKVYHIFQKLPQNALLFIYSSVLCFFGGTFPTLFAAIQAAKHGGRQTVIQALSDLSEEAMIIIEESKKDDEKDEDGDGKSDVSTLSAREISARKFKLVLRKMNPEKVDKAIASIYSVWVSVAAVLSVQFARTIALALSVAEFLEMPCDRFIAPAIKLAIPKDYQKWVPVVLSWIVKSVAMSFAFYIQSIVSGVTSALTGGLMMARALYAFCQAHKLTLFGLLPPNHEDTYVDELLSYLFALLGFYTQVKCNFDVPFPLNLVLWPFDLAEFWIRWSITRRAT